jgi:hypothetical protein
MPVSRNFLLPFFLFPFLTFGQLRNTPYQTTKIYTEYQIGFAYPYIRETNNRNQNGIQPYNYDIRARGLNYGLFAGVGWGLYLGKHSFLNLSPSVLYSKFSSFDVHYEHRTYPNATLISEWNGPAHLSQLSINIPFSFNFKVKERSDFGFGVFILKPILDREYWDADIIEYFYKQYNHYVPYNPPHQSQNIFKLYKNYRNFWRSGIQVRFSFLLKERDWIQEKLILEYAHSFVDASFHTEESWIKMGIQKIFFH